MSKKVIAAQPSWLSRKGLWFLTVLLLKSRMIRRKVQILAETEEYMTWVRETFGREDLHQAREHLWNKMMQSMHTDEWTVFEFGVAWGYATRFWTERQLPGLKTWHGFDRFTGLPRAWRDVEKGAFAADGQTPKIDDSRIIWHVGDVENTLHRIQPPVGPKCILFDLDLYEPTRYAWEYLSDSLNPGDLIYFDEAYDADERRVINELLVKDHQFELLGHTTYALALKYKGRKV